MFSPVYTCNVPVARCARALAYPPCAYVRERQGGEARDARVGSVHGTVETGAGRPASEFKLQRVTRRIGVGNVCPRICRLREFIAYSVAGLSRRSTIDIVSDRASSISVPPPFPPPTALARALAVPPFALDCLTRSHFTLCAGRARRARPR